MKFNNSWPAHQKALYFDQQGNWQQAHELIDHLNDPKSAHVHAYLHRKEGDDWNARYWYNQANQPFFEGALDEEWRFLWAKYCDR